MERYHADCNTVQKLHGSVTKTLFLQNFVVSDNQTRHSTQAPMSYYLHNYHEKEKETMHHCTKEGEFVERIK